MEAHFKEGTFSGDPTVDRLPIFEIEEIADVLEYGPTVGEGRDHERIWTIFKKGERHVARFGPDTSGECFLILPVDLDVPQEFDVILVQG